MTGRQDSDLIVIGAGPAGMAAAITASEAGKSVILLDMQPAPGGQIYRNIERNAADTDAARLWSALGDSYRAGLDLVRRFRDAPGVDYRPETTVWDLRADGVVGWSAQGRAGYLRAGHVIIATGAMERPTPLPGWTLPGVMTAGAVQTLLKAGGLVPEGRLVLAGTGPLLFLLTHQLLALGVRPALLAFTHRDNPGLTALARLRPAALGPVMQGLRWRADIRRVGIPIRYGVTGLAAHGHERVEAVSLTAGGKTVQHDCDLLILHDGIIPTHDLAHAAGLALDWHAPERAWLPRTDAVGRAMLADGPQPRGDICRISVSGDARLRGGAIAAAHHGRLAAAAVVGRTPAPALSGFRKAMALQKFLDAAFPPGLSGELPGEDVILCRCEELTTGQLRAAIRGGIGNLDQLRGVTRCGMGPCQGRSCTASITRLLAEEGAKIPARPFRARPPARPISLGALAGLSGIDPALAKVSTMTNFSGIEAGGQADD